MIFSPQSDIGTKKVIALGRRLVVFRSDLAIRAITQPLNSRVGQAALEGADLVVTRVDQVAYSCKPPTGHQADIT